MVAAAPLPTSPKPHLVSKIDCMSAATKEVLQAALKLPPEEREELIDELSASLDLSDLRTMMARLRERASSSKRW
jgi:hypothetical protein